MKHTVKEHTAEELIAIHNKIAKAMKEGKDRTLGDTLSHEELATLTDFLYDYITIC